MREKRKQQSGGKCREEGGGKTRGMGKEGDDRGTMEGAGREGGRGKGEGAR